MSLAVLLAFLVIGLRFLVFKRLRQAKFFLLAALAWIFVIGSGVVTYGLLSGLQHYSPVEVLSGRDNIAIVVLGGGTVEDKKNKTFRGSSFASSRVFEAARVYTLCKKVGAVCHILASGGDPQKKGVSEAEIMKRDLSAVGVSESDIILEAKSNTTFQNAEFSSAILREQNFSRIVLVTSGVHMRRALTYFSYFLIDALPSPSDYLTAYLSLMPQSFNFAIMDACVHEYLGLFRHVIFNFFGWNPSVSTPGRP